MKKNNSQIIQDNKKQIISGNTTTHNGNGDIILGSKIEQKIISDNATHYEDEKENYILIKKITKFLIDKFGEKVISQIGWGSFISGAIAAFFCFLTGPSVNSSILIIISIILILIGGILLRCLDYKKDSKCTKCNTDYTIAQHKNKHIREVETANGTRQEVTRYYKCTNCENETQTTTSKTLPKK